MMKDVTHGKRAGPVKQLKLEMPILANQMEQCFCSIMQTKQAFSRV